MGCFVAKRQPASASQGAFLLQWCVFDAGGAQFGDRLTGPDRDGSIGAGTPTVRRRGAGEP